MLLFRFRLVFGLFLRLVLVLKLVFRLFFKLLFRLFCLFFMLFEDGVVLEVWVVFCKVCSDWLFLVGYSGWEFGIVFLLLKMGMRMFC